ncbi:homeobox-domain-containing protein [Neoconidiobolus thromboides FSU 785]|nr:homeobox-domain-containing protein [Neoconidiobolus thromboides FSU 785]
MLQNVNYTQLNNNNNTNNTNNDTFGLKIDEKSLNAYLEELGPDANICKNKRSKLTPRQLAYLEATFKTNSSPNHKHRLLISQAINMPERSIQIWFQNRRAKIRNNQRKATLALQEEALRQHYLAAKGQDFGSNFMGDKSTGPFPEFNASNGLNIGLQGYNSTPMPNTNQFSPFMAQSPYFDVNSTAFSTPQGVSTSTFESYQAPTGNTNGILSCMILAIGTWQRMGSGGETLVCGYSCESKQMSWMIGSGDMKFRIRFTFSNVEKIELSFNDSISSELTIDLNQAPEFSSFMNGTWVSCPDFSEGQQASRILRHVLRGEAQALRTQFFDLLQQVPELNNKATIRPTQVSNVQKLSATQLEASRRQSASLISFDANRTPTYPPSNLHGQGDPFNLAYNSLHMKDPFSFDRSRSLSLPTIQQNLTETGNYFNEDEFQYNSGMDNSESYN